MKKAYITYDSIFDTWNVVVDETNVTIFYGTISELEEWLSENKEKFDIRE